jgi:hypothetical protein
MKRLRVDIMLPVYHGNLDEIPDSIQKQIEYYEEALREYDWRIVLAINGKNAENVISLAQKLGRQDMRVTYDYTERPGKGSGIVHSWSRSTADIISYMDIDLSTDIKSFTGLVSGIKAGYDIAIGSRYHPDSTVERSLKRRIVSVSYHKVFMKIILGARTYTDAQCGFKAVSPRVVKEILPLVRNRNWFFESELLYIAEHKGLSIKEIPVNWKESEFSGMKLYRAILEFIRCGISLRLRRLK